MSWWPPPSKCLPGPGPRPGTAGQAVQGDEFASLDLTAGAVPPLG